VHAQREQNLVQRVKEAQVELNELHTELGRRIRREGVCSNCQLISTNLTVTNVDPGPSGTLSREPSNVSFAPDVQQRPSASSVYTSTVVRRITTHQSKSSSSSSSQQQGR
jgi:hypothetical protein